MALQSLRSEIRELWATTDLTASYLAYKYALTEASVRAMVIGLSGPKKKHRSLSAYHRALGMKLIDKRLSSGLDKSDFAFSIGASHIRLNNLEKGYHEINITELIKAELLQDVALLDTALLETE